MSTVRTFEERVKKWNYDERHYLMDMMGIDSITGWKPVIKQMIISDDQLRADIKATDLITGSYWIHQEIPRSKSDVELVFLTIYGEYVWQLSGTLQSLFEHHKYVFASRQIGSISVWLSPGVVKKEVRVLDLSAMRRMACERAQVINGVVDYSGIKEQYTTQVVSEISLGNQVLNPITAGSTLTVVSVFPIVTGPMLTDILWKEGKGIVLNSFTTSNTVYQVMSAPQSTIDVAVPSVVQSAWRKMYFVPKGSVDLLDLDYYYQNYESYSSWSFTTHQIQAASVLAAIPLCHRIVAPGDCWGVLKRVSTGHTVLSTDIVSGIDYTESFSETFNRLQKGDFLVLSYLWNLLSLEDQNKAKTWDRVVLIDSNAYVDGWIRVAEGVFVLKKYPFVSEMGLVVAPEGFHEQSLYFSENLLRIKEISSVVNTQAFAYHRAMRPFSPVTSTGVVLCSRISEAMKHLEKRPYLAPIGKRVDGVVPTQAQLGQKWGTRILYSLPLTNCYVKLIRRNSHWWQDNSFFYFCFSFPCTFGERSESALAKTNVQFSVEDVTDDEEYEFKLKAVTPDTLIWSSSDTRDTVWRRTDFSTYCAYLYLRQHSKSVRGWQNALFGKRRDPQYESTNLWYTAVIGSEIEIKNGVPFFNTVKGPLLFDDDWWTHLGIEIIVPGQGTLIEELDMTVEQFEKKVIVSYGTSMSFVDKQIADIPGQSSLAMVILKYGWLYPVQITLKPMG